MNTLATEAKAGNGSWEVHLLVSPGKFVNERMENYDGQHNTVQENKVYKETADACTMEEFAELGQGAAIILEISRKA